MKRSEFWQLVDRCKWGRTYDYKKIKSNLRLNWPDSVLSDFSETFRFLWQTLIDVYMKWSTDNGQTGYVGDDGLADICAHVIGLGKDSFLEHLCCPEKIKQRAVENNYKESFAYVIPY